MIETARKEKNTPGVERIEPCLAEPNTVPVSAATQRLIAQQFESQPFGSHRFKGFSPPMAAYRVQGERQGIALLTGKETLTPFIGREQKASCCR